MATNPSKTLAELARILKTLQLNYESENRKVFERASKKALKEIGKALGLNPIDVHYNRAGIACSGEATLMGMWSENEGLYFTLDKNLGRPSLMFRSIKHMKDYTGGINRWLHVDDLLDLETLLKTLSSVHKVEKEQQGKTFEKCGLIGAPITNLEYFRAHGAGIEVTVSASEMVVSEPDADTFSVEDDGQLAIGF